MPTFAGVSVTWQVPAPVPLSVKVQSFGSPASVPSVDVACTMPSGSKDGVYVSAVATAVLLEFDPPTRSACAESSIVAVRPERAVFMLPIAINVPAAELYSSVVFTAWPELVPPAINTLPSGSSAAA